MRMLINARGEVFAGPSITSTPVADRLSPTSTYGRLNQHIGHNNSLCLVGPDGRTPNQEVLLSGQRFPP